MLKKIKLGTKILGGFVIVLILTGVVSYVGWDDMRSMEDRVGKADDTNRMIIMILQAGDMRRILF